jgi:sporulation protein YlmC with PRC-barrel domain
MLNNVKALKDYKLSSLDGEIGTVKEFYFDDRNWTIRYLVIDTGGWLPHRKVLISPHALRNVNKQKETIEVNLTKKQIEDSPSLETNRPIDRQFAELYHGYFGWPMYWNAPSGLGNPPQTPYEVETRIASDQYKKPFNLHLRSTQDITKHHVQAIDGEIGHVEDFIVDSKSWTIRYVVVDTQNWWFGKKVLISSKWISHVSWVESMMYINLSQNSIKGCPEYTKMNLITRNFEEELHRHYKRPGYWAEELNIM